MKIKLRSFLEARKGGENIKALLFLTLGSKYLNLVHNVLTESINSGNPHQVISDSVLDFDSYFKKTKWSDFIIIEPVLFNLYQGLELTLKGLLLLTNSSEVKAEHGLLVFLDKVKAINEIPLEIKNVLEELIVIKQENNPLNSFLKTNCINVDELYNSLRYPADKKFEKINNYFDLHYQEEKFLEYFKQVTEDIRKLQKLCTAYYRDMTEQI